MARERSSAATWTQFGRRPASTPLRTLRARRMVAASHPRIRQIGCPAERAAAAHPAHRLEPLDSGVEAPEAELEEAERLTRQGLHRPVLELGGEPDRLAGVGPAFVLPAHARFDQREPREAAQHLGAERTRARAAQGLAGHVVRRRPVAEPELELGERAERGRRASRSRGGLRVRGRRSSRFRVSERRPGSPGTLAPRAGDPGVYGLSTQGERAPVPSASPPRMLRMQARPSRWECVPYEVDAGAPAGGRARRVARRGDGARATRLQRAGGGPPLPRGGGAARPSGPAGRAGGLRAHPRACPARHADRGIRRLRRRRRLLDGDARPHPARARRRPGLGAAEPLRRGLWALGRRGRAARGARDGTARDRRLRGHRGRAGGGGPRRRARRRRHGPPPARTRCFPTARSCIPPRQTARPIPPCSAPPGSS